MKKKTLLTLIALTVVAPFVGIASEKNDGDKVVEALVSSEVLKKGNLEMMSSANQIKLKKLEYRSMEEILEDAGIEPNNCKSIEGTAINSWGVTRYRMSEFYDLYIRYNMEHQKGNVSLQSVLVFVAPHRDQMFGAKLFDSRRWKEIIFSE